MLQKAVLSGVEFLTPENYCVPSNSLDVARTITESIVECHSQSDRFSSNGLKVFQLSDLNEVITKRISSLRAVTPVPVHEQCSVRDAELRRLVSAYHDATVSRDELSQLIQKLLFSEHACELARSINFDSAFIELVVYIGFNFRRIAYDYNDL